MRRRPMVELPQYVQRVVSGGREYFYFRRGEERSPLPDPRKNGEFWPAYQELFGSELPRQNTFQHMIAAYKVSPDFTNLATASQRDYLSYLKLIEKAWGPLLVASLRPKHVIAFRDQLADTPSKANHMLSVLKTLLNWGIPREFCDTNPCVPVPRFDLNEDGAKPWPSWAYPLVEKHAPEGIRRAVWLARYTGQRQADVIRMVPAHVEDEGIHVTQQKTGKELWVPLHADLKRQMRKWGTFVVHTNGEPYANADSFRAAWTRFMNDTPAGRIRQEGFTFHGLRAASCAKLREAGCSDSGIESITGMSQAMVRRYLRGANQKAIAKAAMKRLEGNGKAL